MCFSSYKKVYCAPYGHSKRRGCAKHNGEDWNNICIENESAQDDSERRGEDHGKRWPPELFWVGCNSLLEKSKPGGKKKPRNGKGKECRSHARQKGKACFAMRGETNQCDNGKRKEIAKDKNVFRHHCMKQGDGISPLLIFIPFPRTLLFSGQGTIKLRGWNVYPLIT